MLIYSYTSEYDNDNDVRTNKRHLDTCCTIGRKKHHMNGKLEYFIQRACNQSTKCDMYCQAKSQCDSSCHRHVSSLV